jgi:aldose 1-epimerase
MTNHEKQYLTGSLVPVLHDIDNDVFFAEEGSYNDQPFYGAVMTDLASGKNIIYEVSKDYKYWVVWNDHGDKGFFCPEPATWIIDAPNLPIPASETGYLELAPGQSKTVKTRVYTQ